MSNDNSLPRVALCPTADTTSSRTWAHLALVLWIAGAAVLSMGGLGYYARVQHDHLHRGLVERCDLMLDITESTVRAHVRNEKYNPGMLADLIGALEEVPLVAQIRIADASGTDLLPEVAQPADMHVQHRRVDFMAPAYAAQGEHRRPMVSRGPAPQSGWIPLPAGPHLLTVGIDTARYREDVQAVWLQIGVAGAICLAATLLGGLAILARARQNRLRADLLVARERAAHNEQLARLGAGLAHETKNPLALVRGMAQSLLDDADDAKATYGKANRIIDETDRIVGQINAFLSLARPKEPEFAWVDLGPIFAGLAALVDQEARDKGVVLVADGGGRVVEADPEMLRRALLNLLLNALQACASGDRVRLYAEDSRIVVEDTGPGIAAEDLGRVLEPYFSRTPGGTGLGLAIVDEIARVHGWRCAVASKPGQGTRVALEGVRGRNSPHD